MIFWSFWVLGLILAHQTAKFKLSGQFRFSRHPWGPWGRLSSGVICIWKIYQLFCDSGAALADFFTFIKTRESPPSGRLRSPFGSERGGNLKKKKKNWKIFFEIFFLIIFFFKNKHLFFISVLITLKSPPCYENSIDIFGSQIGSCEGS